jgi:tryptophan halogenase
VPDSLAEKIELFRRRGRVVKYREGAFFDGSWIAVYLGQRVIPEGHDLRADMPDAEAVMAGLESVRREIRAAAEAMPEHLARIRDYCPMDAAA